MINFKLKNFEEGNCSKRHTVLYQIDDAGNAVPQLQQPSQKWDVDHVRMPHNPLSFCRVVNADGTKMLKPRWKIIQEALSNFSEIRDVFEFQRLILSYNKTCETYWNFEAITRLFTEELSMDANQDFFVNTLPFMAKLVLNTPNYITKPIPLLKSGQSGSLSLSSLQIACLLSNAFFCTFPRRFMPSYFTNNSKDTNKTYEYKRFPNINFDTLYCHSSNRSRYGGLKNKMSKLKCLINYFTHMRISMENKGVNQLPTEGCVCCQGNRIITFTRCVLSPTKDLVDWSKSCQMIGEISLDIDSDNDIFSANQNHAKVDFANAFIGGGVLNYGCVQEEILFITHPELLLSRLIVEEMNDLESLCVQGHACFVSLDVQYKGYGGTFEFIGDCTNVIHQSRHGTDQVQQALSMEYDKFGRLRNYMVAIDATNYHRNPEIQYRKSQITREINKVYCGFYKFSQHLHKQQQASFSENDKFTSDGFDFDALPTAVATGKWGCGVYGGDVQLKFLTQLLVCAQLGLHIQFFTFHTKSLDDELRHIFQLLIQAHMSVGDCWQLIMKYSEQVTQCTTEGADSRISTALFQYLNAEIDKKCDIVK